MNVIQNYKSLKLEMKADKIRLNYLKDRKEELYQIYTGVKAVSFGEKEGGHTEGNNVIKLLDKLDEINVQTGLSINQEIEVLTERIKKQKTALGKLEKLLKSYNGIEYDLFYEIWVNGIKPTKAVRIIAERWSYDESHIWKNVYPKLKNNQVKV